MGVVTVTHEHRWTKMSSSSLSDCEVKMRLCMDCDVVEGEVANGSLFDPIGPVPFEGTTANYAQAAQSALRAEETRRGR